MEVNKEIKIFIVDDHKMFLDGITVILNNISGLIILGVAENGKEALKLIPNLKPDILITDIDMPIIDGIELTNQLRLSYPNLKILAVSSHNNSTTISKAIKAGINGYILKNTGKVELLKAINTIFNGENYFTKEVKQLINDSIFNNKEAKKNKVKLSDREKEVLYLIAHEKSTKEIAEKLYVSINTVETHRKNLMRKVGTKNMVGLVKYAIQQGLI
ncbi:response regulator transcription factor [Tenacibaculum sp. S7007]|uniref:Response regulator transcription factor n=1 Tax=Tenacibaculum pelagium TaxID=2759527 RepID=A0A839AQI7_9FLAO|nr:response regulator transcription factor [Tenacibaculum pelagium]MBA6157332.1 response regulator transcription factor [Tenacibaculum pelagium]